MTSMISLLQRIVGDVLGIPVSLMFRHTHRELPWKSKGKHGNQTANFPWQTVKVWRAQRVPVAFSCDVIRLSNPPKLDDVCVFVVLFALFVSTLVSCQWLGLKELQCRKPCIDLQWHLQFAVGQHHLWILALARMADVIPICHILYI